VANNDDKYVVANPNTYASGNKMMATCGHEDPLGHLTGTVCGKCARKNHKKVMGK